MRRFKKVLLCVTGDASANPTGSAVVDRAAALARRNRATLELLAVIEPFPWYTRILHPSAEQLQDSLVRTSADSLETIAARLRKDGLEVVTKVVRGRPYLETIHEVQRGDYDLVIKEAERRADARFGSTDLELLRNCPCPVWLFKPGHGGRPFTRVLATVDPTRLPDESEVLHLQADVRPEEKALNLKIMTLAAALAESEGAEFHVLHAWSAPGESLLRGDVRLPRDQVEDYVASMSEAAVKAFERLLEAVPDTTGRRRPHLLKGAAMDVIPEFARNQGVDLIVMGTVARTGIPGFLIGNTAENILQQVDCSILAIKPDGFVSPIAAEPS